MVEQLIPGIILFYYYEYKGYTKKNTPQQLAASVIIKPCTTER